MSNMDTAVEIAPAFGGRTREATILLQQNMGLHVLSIITRLAPSVFAGIVSILIFSAPARATHEIDHRFIVWGEVSTSGGLPVSGETVSFTVGNDTPIGSAVTDERGGYRVVMHVHDEDLGKVFDMTVRGIKKKVKIEFDPADKVTERGKRVDFTIEIQ